ncbi:hypothetical protein V8C86DRAFT_69591 [Haematococcus lacustris]
MTLFRVLTWLWGLVGVAQVLLYACLLNKLLYWGLWCPLPQQPGTDWLQQVSLDFFLANPAATSISPTTSKPTLPFPLPPLPPLPTPLPSPLLSILTASPNPPPLPPTSLARAFAPPSIPPFPAPPFPPPFPSPPSPPFISLTYNPAPYPSSPPPPPPPSPPPLPPSPPPPPPSQTPPQPSPFQPVPGTGNPQLILSSSPLQPPPLPFPPLPPTSSTPTSPAPPPNLSSMSPPAPPQSSSPAPLPQLPRPSLCVADDLPWQMSRAIFISVLVALMSTASIMTEGAAASMKTLSWPVSAAVPTHAPTPSLTTNLVPSCYHCYSALSVRLPIVLLITS